MRRSKEGFRNSLLSFSETREPPTVKSSPPLPPLGGWDWCWPLKLLLCSEIWLNTCLVVVSYLLPRICKPFGGWRLCARTLPSPPSNLADLPPQPSPHPPPGFPQMHPAGIQQPGAKPFPTEHTKRPPGLCCSNGQDWVKGAKSVCTIVEPASSFLLRGHQMPSPRRRASAAPPQGSVANGGDFWHHIRPVRKVAGRGGENFKLPPTY